MYTCHLFVSGQKILRQRKRQKSCEALQVTKLSPFHRENRKPVKHIFLSQIVFVVKVNIISVWYGFLDARFVTRYFYLMPG